MLNMATDQNSGTVPNIIDIEFGDLDKSTDKKDDQCLLENFQGEIQIKGRYDINKFMENILKNEDKPLILCMQFKDPQRESNNPRYIYLQTTYKMCPPVQKKSTVSAELESNRVNSSNTSMIVVPPSSEKSPDDLSTIKKPKDRSSGNRKKYESGKMSSTRSTLCEQLQNLLFPCPKKESTAKYVGTSTGKNDKGKAQSNGYERDIGDGKHINPAKKQKPKNERSKGMERERKAQRSVAPVGRDIGEIELDGRRFGAIFFPDPDDGDIRLGSGPDNTYGNRRWILEKDAQDLDKARWNIPNWIPADTQCRCTSYFPDGKCKCHEFLQKIGVKEIGPLYVPQSTPYPGQYSDGGPQKSQATSRPYGSKQALPIYKDRKGNTYKTPGDQQMVRESGDDLRRREGNKSKSQITFRPSGDGLIETTNKPNDDTKVGYHCKNESLQTDLKNSASPRDVKDDQKKLIKGEEINSYFCKCGYIPDRNRCKCIPIRYEQGKGPPGNDMGRSNEGKADSRYASRVLPCVSKGTATVDGKSYTAELIIRDDEIGGKKPRQVMKKPEKSPSSGKEFEKAKSGGDKMQSRKTGQPLVDAGRTPVQPSKDAELGTEVVVVPGKSSAVKMPGDGNYPEDLGDRHFYCGCTGLWIEYYSKDRKETEVAKKSETEVRKEVQPELLMMEPPKEPLPLPSGTDIIPGFSFKLESCTATFDKNQNIVDKECLIRDQEIQRFKQSGYKNQPPTLIMNDPYSTPLRIYEVSATEGKRYISTTTTTTTQN